MYALLPTPGTALILLFATPATSVGTFLGAGPLVGLGLISYSAYLWHQPLFAFFRYRYWGGPSWLLFLFLSLLSLALAFFSWKFVEQPFRQRGLFTRPQIFAFGAIASLSMILAGGVISINDGFARRMPQNVEWRSLMEKLDAVPFDCTSESSEAFPGAAPCYFGDRTSPRTVVLYGDSHAQAIRYQLEKQFKEVHVRGVLVGAHPCNLIPRVFSAKKAFFSAKKARTASECFRAYHNLLKFIESESDIDTVIIIGRWTFSLFPIEGEIDELAFDNGEGGHEYVDYREYRAWVSEGRLSDTADAKRSAVMHLLTTMTGTGKQIILVYPIPELGWDIAKVNFFHSGKPLDSLSTSYAVYKSRNRFVLKLFDGYQAPNLIKIKPAEIFCSEETGRCLGQVNTVPLYYDDDHLSDAGAKLVVDKVIEALDASSAVAARAAKAN